MMYFGQKVHPLNFAYAERVETLGPSVAFAAGDSTVSVGCRELAPWAVRLSIHNGNVTDARRYSDGVAPAWRDGAGREVAPSAGAVFETEGFTVSATPSGLDLRWKTGGHLRPAKAAATDRGWQSTEEGKPRPPADLGGIGVNGPQTALLWELDGATAALGFGERSGRLNRLGQSHDHHNVDVVGVHGHHWQRDDFDPAYVAIPFAILKLEGGQYVGLLFDNLERTVLDVGKRLARTLMFQAMDGPTDLYLLAGPTLRDVTRHFAELTGRAELPPLWAIGHHQCRWGYENEAEFRRLAERYEEFAIPNSVLWYDIDYMDGYRVFTWDPRDFPAPRQLNDDLHARGFRAVAIVDPGVKRDPGYAVHDSGMAAEVFCLTESGRPYVGSVWPGDTLFPDFTLPAVRAWWADHLARWMTASGIDGVWLDMNDPSTGDSSSDEMRFEHGQTPHAHFHNQYAHFMCMASRAAFEQTDPQIRPFVLTRSASTGTQRHAAVWTGDNVSNWQHLRMSIPCTLNLGLSGVAFNGPDVGGFMGHGSQELLTRWYQAGFLFPFFRNHSLEGTKPQEPWEFGPVVRERIADVIRTRYRLLPHLYQLFWEHHLHGDPLLRPLCYEFDDAGLEHIDDQFLLGPSLMAAPMVHSWDENHSLSVDGEQKQFRAVTLPAGGWWFDLNRGEWLAGGQTVRYAVGFDESPLFVRDGSILPWHQGELANARTDFRAAVELHVFSREQPARGHYHLDDQATRAYLLNGEHNRVTFSAGRDAAGNFFFTHEENGPLPTGATTWTPVFYGATGAETASLLVNGERREAPPAPGTRRWIGKDVPVMA